MINNIVFDVGNVLVRWDPQGCLRKMGFEEDAVAVISNVLFNSGYWNEEDRSILPYEQIEDLLASASGQYQQQMRYYYQHAELSVKQYDYTKPWINRLHQMGYKVYVLSNYGKRIFDRIENTEMDFVPLLDGAVFSYQIGKIKPEEEIYRELLNRYNLKAEECLFFDDIESNIIAARKYGFEGVVFKSYKQAMDYINSIKVEN